MSTLRSLILKKGENNDKEFEKNLDYTRARTVGVDSASSPNVTARPGYIWVIEHTLNGGYTQVFNAGVPNQVGIPVLVSYSPKKPYIRQAHSIDWDNVKNVTWSAGGTTVAGGSAHGKQHEWRDWDPGYDVINVYPRNLVPLRSFPTDSLSVYVDYCRYQYDRQVRQFEGVTYDWSAYANASPLTTTFVLVYLDMQTNSMKAVANTVTSSLVGAIPVEHYPTLPDYALPSCVIMHNTQTATTETMITDVRDLYVYEDSRVYAWLDAMQNDLYDVQADIYALQTDLYGVKWAMVFDSRNVPLSLYLYDDVWTRVPWQDPEAIIIEDTHSGLDSSTDRYTVPEDGDYHIRATVDLEHQEPTLTTDTVKLTIGVYINGSLSPYQWEKFDIVEDVMINVISFPVGLVAGDYMQVFVNLETTQSPVEIHYKLAYAGYRI